MEVGVEGRMYTYRYTVTTRMTFALRWAAIRAILMFDNCEGQSHKTVSTDHNKERTCPLLMQVTRHVRRTTVGRSPSPVRQE